jgi:Uma2 family endonuclease
MSDLIIQTPALIVPAGEIIAQNVSEEDYLAKYADAHCEWVEGYVIRMSPTKRHQHLLTFLDNCFQVYFLINPIGEFLRETFLMRVAKSYRKPDLFIVLKENAPQLSETMMQGAADICIEIVSPESVTRDYGDKLTEYETAGVREYWVIDPLHEQAIFYRLQENGHYLAIALDSDENYTTPLLPKFYVHVPTLWQEALPNILEVAELVKAMWQE